MFGVCIARGSFYIKLSWPPRTYILCGRYKSCPTFGGWCLFFLSANIITLTSNTINSAWLRNFFCKIWYPFSFSYLHIFFQDIVQNTGNAKENKPKAFLRWVYTCLTRILISNADIFSQPWITNPNPNHGVII